MFGFTQYPENFAIPLNFVLFLKCRLLFNIFYCFCMFVNKHFRYLRCAITQKVNAIVNKHFRYLRCA